MELALIRKSLIIPWFVERQSSATTFQEAVNILSSPLQSVLTSAEKEKIQVDLNLPTLVGEALKKDPSLDDVNKLLRELAPLGINASILDKLQWEFVVPALRKEAMMISEWAPLRRFLAVLVTQPERLTDEMRAKIVSSVNLPELHTNPDAVLIKRVLEGRIVRNVTTFVNDIALDLALCFFFQTSPFHFLSLASDNPIASLSEGQIDAFAKEAASNRKLSKSVLTTLEILTPKWKARWFAGDRRIPLSSAGLFLTLGVAGMAARSFGPDFMRSRFYPLFLISVSFSFGLMMFSLARAFLMDERRLADHSTALLTKRFADATGQKCKRMIQHMARFELEKIQKNGSNLPRGNFH